MEDFFNYDSSTAGSKGLVLIGEKILVYRRDENTKLYPLHLDLPGGGPEANETPFETFQREVREEFALQIEPKDIVYVRKYPSTLEVGKTAYFPVAQLPESVAKDIRLGDEGIEYLLLGIDEYIKRNDAWPIFQERTVDYLESLSS